MTLRLEIPDCPPCLTVSCVIPGEPLSKQRPRFGRGHAYDPIENARAQANIGLFIRSTHKSIIPDAVNRFSVRLFFFLKSGQRRDLDNMCKLVMDACTGLVWDDDHQVTEVVAQKTNFDDNPRTEVQIYAVGPLNIPTSICEHCGHKYRTYKSWSKIGLHRRFCSNKCHVASRYEPIFVPCCTCGNQIKHEKRYIEKNKTGRFFCSKECRDVAGVSILNCLECGKEFKRPKSLIKGKNNFCSVPCTSEYKRKQSKCAHKKRSTTIELEPEP